LGLSFYSLSDFHVNAFAIENVWQLLVTCFAYNVRSPVGALIIVHVRPPVSHLDTLVEKGGISWSFSRIFGSLRLLPFLPGQVACLKLPFVALHAIFP
jgi:hypothetical protein